MGGGAPVAPPLNPPLRPIPFRETSLYCGSYTERLYRPIYRVAQKNATLAINDFKKTRDGINKLCPLLRIKFFFQQDDTKIIHFDFLPRFHWPMEFAAPGDSWLCIPRSVSTRCAAHTTPPLMGGDAFYSHRQCTDQPNSTKYTRRWTVL